MRNLELASARVRKGMTQSAMADAIGLTPANYNAKEWGTRAFTLLEVERMAEILELDLADVDRIFFKGKLTKRISDSAPR